MRRRSPSSTRSRFRTLLAAVMLAAGIFGTTEASAVPACPSPACTDIAVVVTDPHGNPVAGYGVLAQRADGYNETKSTDAAGRVDFGLPLPPPNGCYQIVGKPDAFYANTFLPYKVCSDATVPLRPAYRINGVSGQQKVYLGDTSAKITVPVEVSALSRTYPAPFHGDKLPYVFQHYAPHADGVHHHGHDIPHNHGPEGAEMGQSYFGPPTVREIAPGIWQYLWKYDIELPAGEPGYYDMDWGRRGSTFSPMMECRMIWFGYGIGSISPAKAVPLVTTVTVKGVQLGSTKGSLVMRGAGQVTRISGAQITSWTDTEISFVVPPGTKSGWVTVEPPAGVATNAQHLQVVP